MDARSDEPSRPVPRAIIASSDDDLSTDGTDPRRRLALWIGAILSILAVVAVALVLLFPGQSREETAAIRAAVSRYAEMFHEPPQKVYQYAEIQTRREPGGVWRVSITRVIIPDSLSGYGITSNFRVDRNGKCDYVGQVEKAGK